jgi:hypothetical protein
MVIVCVHGIDTFGGHEVRSDSTDYQADKKNGYCRFGTNSGDYPCIQEKNQGQHSPK